MSQEKTDRSNPTADRLVAKFQAIDEKVNAMRTNVDNDPDSLGDKLFKYAVPSLVGLLSGKIFKTLWDNNLAKHRSVGQDETADEQQESFMASIAFAGLSALVTAVASQLGDRGSQAIVDRRHKRK